MKNKKLINMKNFQLKQVVIALLLITIGAGYEANAQVTIGSNNPPAKGALLELKTQEPSANIQSVTDAGNITVDQNGGGLGLPRVQLVDRTTLEPFVSITDPEWTSGTSHIREYHAGLTVYNLTDDPAINLRQGVYVWNGSKWSMEGGKQFFYLPSFNVKVNANISYTINLYEEYERQFGKAKSNLFVSNNDQLETISSLENGDLYTKDELDYVVTYYDADVMDKPTFGQGANSSEMTFTVTHIDQISAKTFFTILVVVK
jgi:hypothetical protein